MRRTLTPLIVATLLACGRTEKAAPRPADGPAPVTQVSFCGQTLPTDSRDVSCADPEVTDLLELSALRSLRTISLSGTGVHSLHQLRDVSGVVHLSLSRTALADLSSFDAARWPKLEFISLSGTAITDLRPLSALPALKTLQLNGAAVADLAPLTRIATLAELTVASSAVTRLPELPALGKLDISGTVISDLAPLRGAPRLEALSMNRTLVQDVSPLVELTMLVEVNATHTLLAPAPLDALRRARPDLKLSMAPPWTGSLDELRTAILASDPPRADPSVDAGKI